MELFKAHSQWSERPADERFDSLESLSQATKQYADIAKEKDVKFSDIRVEANSGDVQLVGKAGIPAKLTHWAFGQLAARVGAPASYLRELPATLAAQNLNHGLAARVKEFGEDSIARLLFHANGGLLLRALTSEKYERIWNYEVAERLLKLRDLGWDGARPTTAWGADPTICIMCQGDESRMSGCQYCKGTGKAMLALYASDHDMFAFVTNSQITVKEAGTDAPLYRGVIVSNSEVGAATLSMTKFLYREMCGNHIIWGATGVTELNLRHVGDIRDRFSLFATKVREYAEESPSDEEAKIKTLKHKLIAGNKADVLDELFGIRNLGISRKALGESYDAVKPDEDGDANTVWGFVQGVTRHSQTLNYADERTKLDKAAGKILEAEF